MDAVSQLRSGYWSLSGVGSTELITVPQTSRLEWIQTSWSFITSTASDIGCAILGFSQCNDPDIPPVASSSLFWIARARSGPGITSFSFSESQQTLLGIRAEQGQKIYASGTGGTGSIILTVVLCLTPLR